MERPEDTTVIRASYTKLSPIASFVTGGTQVCQLTLLDKTVAENLGDVALIEDYVVTLNSDGCTITLRE